MSGHTQTMLPPYKLGNSVKAGQLGLGSLAGLLEAPTPSRWEGSNM
jgi:hypothetical protein